ncbi:DUF4926 domain-containing protein [Salisaeta longa]|uniref:DUF4926 domain-containing protein n=1 Tax=Salisaeta longa TaxID=503170 RepID=UPI0003B4F85E|nr:DUF4926 domain-containing protein [Salisaeta longa]
MIEELSQVVLTEDLPEHHLEAGDIGTVVLVHRSAEEPSAAAGYEVEFTALDGETLTVTSVRPEQVRLARPREVPHARALG